tara:strand:+ start:948 stop:1697 length:750 start_codon:yes stop_codon:yes gene_type:complete
MSEKLQKVLARAAFGSRREIETWIIQKRIRVNGKIAQIGDRVSDADRILVDGKRVNSRRGAEGEKHRYLLYNKPENEICAKKDPQGRPTVFEKLPALKHGRWISIGRLDFNTTGLLLFTTDGDIANQLTHPSSMIEREYAVRVMGSVDPNMIRNMYNGVAIDDTVYRFTDIQYFGGEGLNRWYHVVVMTGRNREVRKLWESQGMKVSRLKRVRFGPIFMPSTLRRGQFQELPRKEVDKLLRSIKTEART